MAYIALKRELSPTAAAVQFFNAIPDAVNLGQGREVDEPAGRLGALLKAELKSSSKYNSAPGGEMAVREAAAAWMARFLGLPAQGANTFVIQQLGREGLAHAMKAAALKHEAGAKIIVPETRWPMVDEIAGDERMPMVEYKVVRDGLSEEIEKAIGAGGDIAAAYFNYPHNPTGMHITAQENKKVMAALDSANAAGKNILRIDDLPYFGGCPQNAGGKKPYLEVGYDGILDPEGKTLWIAIMSFSKAFGCANPGMSVLVVHPAIAAELSKRLTRTTGLAYVPDYFDHVREIFGEDNDAAVLEHFAALNKKYIANRKALEDAFGDRVQDGDPGMTSLLKVPAELFGRAVTCADGDVRTMADLNDIIEFLGNEGVITVNNGADLLRLAQAAHPDKFAEGVARLKAAFDKILHSPAVAAA